KQADPRTTGVDVIELLGNIPKPAEFSSMPQMMAMTLLEARPLVLQGKFGQAVDLLSGRLEIARRAGIENSPEALFLWRMLADSQDMFTKLLDAQRRLVGTEVINTVVTMSNIGFVRLQSKKFIEAEASLREAANIFDRTAPDAWERFNVRSMLGDALAGQKRY